MLSKRSHYTKKSILYDSIPIKFKTMAKPNCDVSQDSVGMVGSKEVTGRWHVRVMFYILF